MKGWIFGSKVKNNGLKNLSAYFQISESLYQNYKHIKALESLLGIDSSKLHSGHRFYW
ncbi:hypothetical protein ACT691_11775 [Vibrio metschnikovii]